MSSNLTTASVIIGSFEIPHHFFPFPSSSFAFFWAHKALNSSELLSLSFTFALLWRPFDDVFLFSGYSGCTRHRSWGIATWGVRYNGMGCHEYDTILDGLGGADANG